jgi:XTP/dITP diphosphohydrolase
MPRLLVATRSADKLREIRQILSSTTDVAGIEIVSLDEIGVAEEPAEDDLEMGATFAENAVAKAVHFASRTGLVTLADDSGLCVDALAGAPGVLSKRYSGRTDLRGAALDRSNNELLLGEMAGRPPAERSARYVCAVAIAAPGADTQTFEGRCEGVILDAPRGSGGFGYDPLFFLPAEDATFGELPPHRKNELSHRSAAVRAAAPAARRALDR